MDILPPVPARTLPGKDENTFFTSWWILPLTALVCAFVPSSFVEGLACVPDSHSADAARELALSAARLSVLVIVLLLVWMAAMVLRRVNGKQLRVWPHLLAGSLAVCAHLCMGAVWFFASLLVHGQGPWGVSRDDEYIRHVGVPEDIDFLVPQGYVRREIGNLYVPGKPGEDYVKRLHAEAEASGKPLDIPAPGVLVACPYTSQPGIYDMTLRLPAGARTDGTYEVQVTEVTTGNAVELATPLSCRVTPAQSASGRPVEVCFPANKVYTGDWCEYYGSAWIISFKPDAGGPAEEVSRQYYLMEGWMR